MKNDGRNRVKMMQDSDMNFIQQTAFVFHINSHIFSSEIVQKCAINQPSVKLYPRCCGAGFVNFFLMAPAPGAGSIDIPDVEPAPSIQISRVTL